MSKRQATTKIIAGTFKGTKIPFKPSKLLRPTENKTKETLFNWLLNDLNKKICLDMFAGTGSLGIEAISRGAEFVLFVEKDKRLCSNIESIIKNLNVNKSCKIINSNSLSLDYSTLPYKFDLIFIDPPFNENLVNKSLETVIKKNLLSQNGVIYIECEKSYVLNSEMYGLRKIKESKGGEVKFYLYEG